MRRPSLAPAPLAALVAAAALLAGSADAAAQQGPFRLDARAGISLPTSDLKDYVDEGLVLGAGLAGRISDRLALRLDWTSELMPAADRRPLRSKGVDIPADGSETDLHHVTAGLQARLSEQRAAVQVRVHAGAGVVFLSTEATELAEGGDFTQFTAHGGIELGFRVNHRVRLIGRGDVYAQPFRSGAPSHLQKEVTLPVTAGISVGL